jgi:hypothetical protein
VILSGKAAYFLVMPGLGPGIYVSAIQLPHGSLTGHDGTNPVMTG